ncbi:MAG: DNA polymerase IV [Candidatus Bipolaricaulis sp.]|nr:DNA polymerase IV [Candidatus Bipolaricaulis sp.]MDD5219444.1 DNA polymerase IV [Candidatus Bipolaricaulis sp.]MDD5646337.1 DNA polymerase IV [Candidatus Bipolaricaulis sp.]
MSGESERWIGHLDMDAFFASVEQLDEPAYRGKPVIVGGLGPRGVVATASYEARVYGVHSAMPMALAHQRCPDGVFLPGRFERYREVSERVRAIILRATPVIETISLDEAFFDLSHHGDAVEVAAREIQRSVESETGLTCSVGLAPNRFLAKLASELDKPRGFRVIGPAAVRQTLDPLPVGKLWGVGEVTERRLRGLGLLRVTDLRQADVEFLVREFGSYGERLFELAHGRDDTPIAGEAESRSISRETTYGVDLISPDEIQEEIARMARLVAGSLIEESLLCRTVRIKIRYPDFRTVTRQVRLGVAVDAESVIEAVAVHLLRHRVNLDDRGVRLIGVGVGGLVGTSARQLPLF